MIKPKNKLLTRNRGIFRALWNIQEGKLCGNCLWLKAVNFFHKTLHLRHLTEFWIFLWENPRQFSCVSCGIWGFTLHVRLVWDIYCAHAYLCRYDSTLFCFRKLRPTRLSFLINCLSNLTINIVNRTDKKKKMKSEWLTMPTLTKENVIFDSKLSPG